MTTLLEHYRACRRCGLPVTCSLWITAKVAVRQLLNGVVT